jgi:two-component system sensor histidine kinase and response regulator WspE
MMRAAHSIKGAAAIVGLDVVVQLAHGMEDAFVAAQRGQLQLTARRIDVLLAGVDLILQCSTQGESALTGWLAQNAARLAEAMHAIAQVEQLQDAPPLPPAVAPAAEAPPAPEEAAPQAAAHAPRAAVQNYDQLLALASETRINAHQLAPIGAALQRFKRNQASLFQAIDQLHEALGRSADAGLIEKSALALQKTSTVTSGAC